MLTPTFLRDLADSMERQSEIDLLANNIRHITSKLRKPPSTGMKVVAENGRIWLRQGRYGLGTIIVEPGTAREQNAKLAEVFAAPEWDKFGIYVITR